MGFLNRKSQSVWQVVVITAALLTTWELARPASRVFSQSGSPLLVIISAATGATDVDIATLRRVFENELSAVDGFRLIPLNLPPGSTARSRFDRVLLGLAPDRMGAYWINQRVRFGKTPPRVIPSPALVMRVVASLKGAIGYLEMDPSSVPSALTVLSVEGKAPNEPGYLFAVETESND
jgi:hypothetical protein